MEINYPLIIFSTLVLISITILIIYLLNQPLPQGSTNSGLLGDSSSCSVSSLPDVTLDPRYKQCKSLDGSFYSSYWYDSNVDFDWVLGPLSSPQFSQTPEQICFGKCYQGSLPYTCSPDNTDYSSCVNQLSPGDCSTPTRPMAVYDNVALYVISTGSYSCL